MNNQSLQQALNDLPGEAQGPSVTQVRALGKLVDGDLPLQSFLEQLLPVLTDLFGGLAAVAWMKADGAVFGVRYRMDNLLASVSEQKKHERLVQLAWRQKQPVLAEPAGGRWLANGEVNSGATGAPTAEDANPSAGQATGNPTGYPLLFGPILHLGEPVALLEIVLAEDQRPLSKAQRQLYLRGVKLISERVYGGLRQRMNLPAATLDQAKLQLEQLRSDVHSIQQQIVRDIEGRLQKFHGWAFTSLAENQAFAKLVHQLLDSHGLRVICPECGNPAILRCLRAGNAKHGAFVFDHYLDAGRTFHGGATMVPLIRVVNKPARRAALSNPA